MKKVKADTLTLYLNISMTVFTGIQKQLPENKKVIEGISLISRLNPFICTQVNGKVNTSFPSFRIWTSLNEKMDLIMAWICYQV